MKKNKAQLSDEFSVASADSKSKQASANTTAVQTNRRDVDGA